MAWVDLMFDRRWRDNSNSLGGSSGCFLLFSVCSWLLGFFLRGSASLLLFTSLFACLLGQFSLLLLFFSLGLEERFLALVVIWDEVKSAHVRSQDLRNRDTLGRLIILQDAAHRSRCCAHRAIKHVNVDLVICVFQRVSRLKTSRLIICAIRARNKLSEGIVAWEPSFQIVLFGCSVVELARDNIDNLIRQTKSLVELFRSLNHFLELVPGLIGFAVNELLNLFELVDAEDTPDVSAVGAGLLTEAGGDAGVAFGEIGRFDPFLHVHGRDWLFGSGDQVEGLVIVALDFVQVFSEVRQLASVLHNALLHEVRWLHLSVISLIQLGKTVVDKRLIEHDSQAFQVVATVTSDARATFHLDDAQALHDLMVSQLSKLTAISDNRARCTPCTHDRVVGFVLRNDDIAGDDISDLTEHLLRLRLNILRSLLLSLHSVVKSLRFGL